MIDYRQYEILRGMLAHGEPVQKTTGGFELGAGQFLCRMADMSALKGKGLVEKLGNTHFGLTPAGREVAGRKEIWELTREEYFNDQTRVRDDVSIDTQGFRINYQYETPHPAGPFKGMAILNDYRVLAGDLYAAPFGTARVTSVSKEKITPEKIDLMDLLEAGKALHKKSVFDAVIAELPVREEVLVDYPELPGMINEYFGEDAAPATEAPAP